MVSDTRAASEWHFRDSGGDRELDTCTCACGAWWSPPPSSTSSSAVLCLVCAMVAVGKTNLRVGAGATALTTCRSGGRRLVVRANGLPSSSPAASSPSPPSAPAAPLPLAVRKRISIRSNSISAAPLARTHSTNPQARQCREGQDRRRLLVEKWHAPVLP